MELAREDGARQQQLGVHGSAATREYRGAVLQGETLCAASLQSVTEKTGVQYSVTATSAGMQDTANLGTSSASASSAIGNALTLRFVTPTRMRIKSELLENPSFAQLIRSLSLRLSMLAQTHSNAPLDYDYRTMIEHAENVSTCATGLRLVALDRRSNRQDSKLAMDGFTGGITFAGPAVAELMPLVVAGEFLNLGSGTAFGLGRYTITT